MRTLVVCGTKGGTGKSSIGFALAVEAARAGRRVVLLDGDEQGTATLLVAARDREPAIPCIRTKQPHHELERLADRFDLAVVDVGGRVTDELKTVIAKADELLVPLRPGPGDIWSLADLFAVIDAVGAKYQVPPVSLALVQVPPGHIGTEARDLIADEIRNRPGVRLLRTEIAARVAWPRATGAGLSPAEAEPSGPAADELSALVRELGIFRTLRKG